MGLPGSGKTTIGRQLARRLGLPFVDSDHVIEDRLGCSIREFFAREGEDSFRDVEQQVLDDLSQHHQGVLATGGGSVLREINRRHLHERGHVIYLRSAPEDVYRRVRHDTGRPLLQVDDPLPSYRFQHVPGRRRLTRTRWPRYQHHAKPYKKQNSSRSKIGLNKDQTKKMTNSSLFAK